MIPTEHEYTVATQAAAEKRYEIYVKSNPDQQLPPWSELERGSRLRQTFLENVLPLVDAAISAIPDRLQIVRDAIAAADGDPDHPGDDDLLTQIRLLVDA